MTMKRSIQRQLFYYYQRSLSYYNSCHYNRRITAQTYIFMRHRFLVSTRSETNNDGTVHHPIATKDASYSKMIIQYPSNAPIPVKHENSDGNHHKKYGTNATIYTDAMCDDSVVNNNRLYTQSTSHAWKEKKPEIVKNESNNTRYLRRTLYDTILIHFVPVQYPISVQQPGYTMYATYSFIAAIAGSASMVISTQILLSTMFTVTSTTTAASSIGTSTSTAATAGALNWVMKDGIGQLGGIIVASQMGNYHAFDNNPKRYRMYSAMLLDLAAFIEICTPLLS